MGWEDLELCQDVGLNPVDNTGVQRFEVKRVCGEMCHVPVFRKFPLSVPVISIERA